MTGRDLFSGTGFNYVLSLNKKCHIDFSVLTLKKVPPHVIVIFVFIEGTCLKNVDQRSKITAICYWMLESWIFCLNW